METTKNSGVNDRSRSDPAAGTGGQPKGQAHPDRRNEAALAAGIATRVYPHLLRHSIPTLPPLSGDMLPDQVQKFLGQLQIGTTQLYTETSLRPPQRRA